MTLTNFSSMLWFTQPVFIDSSQGGTYLTLFAFTSSADFYRFMWLTKDLPDTTLTMTKLTQVSQPLLLTLGQTSWCQRATRPNPAPSQWIGELRIGEQCVLLRVPASTLLL